MATTFPEGTVRGLVDYPFQLRPDVWVTLRLPADLDTEDIAALVVFLKLLANEKGGD